MQTFSNEITFSVNKSRSSGFFIYHFVVHSGLLWYVIVVHYPKAVNRMMS
jgi:hypothetical protein